jgi:hypothetical protein
MAKHYLPDIFRSIKISQFPFMNINSYSAFQSGDAVRVLISRENTLPSEQAIFNKFLEVLEIVPTLVNNFGIASYRDEVFSYFCPTYFGLRNGEMGLLIGANYEKYGATDIFVPCQCEKMPVPYGRKTIEEWVYTLNGSPIKLIDREDSDGKISFYLSLEARADGDNDDEFIFPFLLDKSRVFDIRNEFKSGNFSSVLREFGAGSNLYIKANKAFTHLFREGSFPSEGVLLICKNGQEKKTLASEHQNLSSDISEVQWEIVASSHPELLINFYRDREHHFASLNEATVIQFSSAAFSNEGYNWLADHCDDFRYDGYVAIHIIKPSKRKIDHTPVNTCSNLLAVVKEKLKKFPQLIPVIENIGYDVFVSESGVSGMLPGNPVKAIAQLPSASTTDSIATELDEIDF